MHGPLIYEPVKTCIKRIRYTLEATFLTWENKKKFLQILNVDVWDTTYQKINIWTHDVNTTWYQSKNEKFSYPSMNVFAH